VGPTRKIALPNSYPSTTLSIQPFKDINEGRKGLLLLQRLIISLYNQTSIWTYYKPLNMRGLWNYNKPQVTKLSRPVGTQPTTMNRNADIFFIRRRNEIFFDALERR
jgi:hypothetical protein